MTQTKKWQLIAETRQKHLADTIAAVEPSVPDVPKDLPLNVTGLHKQLLPADVVSITEQLPEQLVEQLASGAITSTAVVKAFLQRAGLASKLTNCITELLPERALERAKFLDEYYAKHKKPIGPLHGLPISVKEHYSMKGLDLNCGFVSWVGRIAEDDALILKLFWKAGAVFHARTTEPQTLMHLETSSNVHGVTSNPFNTGLTSGGSSGGEGSLQGQRGSLLGVGSDIGGSIRSPAANNGIFGLRPTSYRVPITGMAATQAGEEQIIPVVGPLSTSLAGIDLFMRALLDQKPWLHEPTLVPIPWRRPDPSFLRLNPTTGRRHLRIGVLADDGIVRPHPPILRGIDHLVSRLKQHPEIFELVDFPPYNHDEAWDIISTLYFADGGAEEREAIDSSGEPWRPLSKFILLENENVRRLSVEEIWGQTVRRDGYRARYAGHWNGVNGGRGEGVEVDEERLVDVLLCPVGPGCAPGFDEARYWNYTSQWNLLDYPALVFPTGLACGSEDEADPDYKPRNAKDEYNHKLYSPEKYKDAPISLQLVARRYEDEKLVEAMKLILDETGLEVNNLSVNSLQ